MKTFLACLPLFLGCVVLHAQYGGYNPANSSNFLGDNSSAGVFTDITYNDGSITSSSSATIYFVGSNANTQHQILSNTGGATATQIGIAVLQNGSGGLLINNTFTGLEIIHNFNFNGQNAQVSTLRDATSIVHNNLHIDANATISGSDNENNVNGYVKKDGDGQSFSFPLSDGNTYAAMTTGALGLGNSITAAYYHSSPSSGAAFQGGPFPVNSVSLAELNISSAEYWNTISSGSPLTTLSLTFQGDYSAASIASLFIVGWKISTSQWEIVPSNAASGLTPGNSISSVGNIDFSNYSAFTLGFIPPPVVTAIALPTTCGKKNGSLIATGTKGIPPYTFSLDGINFQSNDTFTELDSGNYEITIKDSYNLTDTETVNIGSSPPGKIFVGNDTSIAINQPFQLNVIDLNNSEYNQFSWSPPDGLNDPSIQNPIATLNKDITYSVTATNAYGCQTTAQIAIKVYVGPEIYVPSAFTPNGDGKNDILKAIPVGLKTFSYFSVYDRGGRLVFSTTNASNGWNGKIGNKLQDMGTYVWVAQGIEVDGKTIVRKGSVVLIR